MYVMKPARASSSAFGGSRNINISSTDIVDLPPLDSRTAESVEKYWLNST
jgi:hypothetical protein